MTPKKQIRLYRLMEKLNWFFHQEMHYLNRDIAEKTSELQEYQRIAVLISLDAIHSDLLPQYLERAKQDGRSYLLEHAERIEGKQF